MPWPLQKVSSLLPSPEFFRIHSPYLTVLCLHFASDSGAVEPALLRLLPSEYVGPPMATWTKWSRFWQHSNSHQLRGPASWTKFWRASNPGPTKFLNFFSLVQLPLISQASLQLSLQSTNVWFLLPPLIRTSDKQPLLVSLDRAPCWKFQSWLPRALTWASIRMGPPFLRSTSGICSTSAILDFPSL